MYEYTVRCTVNMYNKLTFCQIYQLVVQYKFQIQHYLQSLQRIELLSEIPKQTFMCEIVLSTTFEIHIKIVNIDNKDFKVLNSCKKQFGGWFKQTKI